MLTKDTVRLSQAKFQKSSLFKYIRECGRYALRRDIAGGHNRGKDER